MTPILLLLAKLCGLALLVILAAIFLPVGRAWLSHRLAERLRRDRK